MSTLKVEQIQSLSGKPLLKNTGSILQIVNANTVGLTGEVTTTSATYVTTGFSLSITPISASSKLFVEFCGNVKFNAATDVGDNGCAFKIYRDGSAINSTNSGDSLFYRSDSAATNQHGPCSIIHFINANSTASTTFTLFFADLWGGTAVYSRSWGTQSLTITEISA